MTMGTSISRRNFLTAAALGGAAASAAFMPITSHALANETEAAYSGDLPATWDYEADVVVVGTGSAGLSTAWFALDGGLSTICVEQMFEPGGASLQNAGQIAFGSTNVQKRLGYTTTPEQFKSWLKTVGTGGVPDELLDVYVYEGSNVIDWLESIGVEFGDPEHADEGLAVEDDALVYTKEDGSIDVELFDRNAINSLGVEFHPKYIDGWQGSPEPICHMARFSEWTDQLRDFYNDGLTTKTSSMDAHHGGTAYMVPILNGVTEMGGTILLDTRAVKGYKDETGRVCGIMCEAKDGLINIKANRAVVIAGGNWLTDKNLAETYAGHLYDCGLQALSVADGGVAAKIGLDMGGHMANTDSYWLCTESSFFVCSFLTSRITPISKSILVDGNGARFIAEDLYSPIWVYEMATRRQIDNPARQQYYLIMNDEYYQKHIDYLNQRVIEGYAGTYQQMPNGEVSEEIENEADYSTMTHADTIEELAEKLDLPFLPTQVRIYNESVEAGTDLQWGRFPENLVSFDNAKGPVHAAELVTSYVGGYSSGGLDVNVHGQVLDHDMQPIPGLYAAGRSGRSFAEGTHHPSTGMSCAMGMLTGRNIGMYLAVGEPADEAAGAVSDTTYADGVYEAAGTGIHGDVPVAVTVEGGRISSVTVGENSETQGIGSNAIEQLPDAIVAANGIDGVDGVSGATVTSGAIFTAVKDCLEQAGA